MLWKMPPSATVLSVTSRRKIRAKTTFPNEVEAGAVASHLHAKMV